jgi:putative (di)nucleoside polyphosphate hydrolase
MDVAALPYRPCVGLMLINSEGRIFCGERRDTPGAWQMPQGGIQKGEDPAVAARRELKEEIGVEKAEIISRSTGSFRYDFPDFLEHHSVYKGKYRGQEQFWFLFRYLGTDAEVDLVSHNDHEGPEFGRWEWCTPTDVLRRIVPFKRAVYEAVLAEFAPLITKA